MEPPKTFKEKVKGLLSSTKKGIIVIDKETGNVYELETETLWVQPAVESCGDRGADWSGRGYCAR